MVAVEPSAFDNPIQNAKILWSSSGSGSGRLQKLVSWGVPTWSDKTSYLKDNFFTYKLSDEYDVNFGNAN